MAKKYALSWHKPTRRWRKRYKGKEYWFPFGSSKTDEQGYKLALEAWEHRKAEIDGRTDEDSLRAIDNREQILSWNDQSVDDEPIHTPQEYVVECYHFVEQIENELDELHRNRNKAKPLTLDQLGVSIDPLYGRQEGFKELWRTRVPNLGRQEQPRRTTYTTIQNSANTYLAQQRQRVKSGQLSLSYYQSLEGQLSTLTKIVDPSTPSNSINTTTFRNIHTRLLEMIENKEITPAYAKTLFATFKRLVKWLYAEEMIDALPRILISSGQLTFNVRSKPIETYKIDEIHELLMKATERTRLYILLALNCGYTQEDISRLRPVEVNWKAGRIIRKRSKTEDQQNVPVVNYKLWPSTLKLLKKHRSKRKDHVLLNENGTPLRYRDFDKNIDNIRSAFERLLRRLKWKKGKTFKHLRKTSSSLLASHETYGRYAEHFLGHAPSSIGDKHYIKPSEELFDNSIEWLGEQYRLKDI